MYEEWPSTSRLARCLWRYEVTADGERTEPANEYWGVVFETDPAGEPRALLIGPSLVPRPMILRAGERGWGIELHAHVFWRGLEKLPPDGRFAVLPCDGDTFLLAGERYPVPGVDGLDDLVAALAARGTLVAEPHVERALSGVDPYLSERSMQRLFGRTTGLRRVQITQLRRAAQAYALLQRGVPIGEAAARAGFADQAHLTRAFRVFVGRTPARILAEAR